MSHTERLHSRPLEGVSTALRRAWHVLERLPGLVAITYATVLVIVGKAVVEANFSDADMASGPLLGELYHGGDVILGHYNWYEALWLELATRWIPLHRYLWSYGAWVLSMIGIALVAWSAARATGRRWTGITLFAICFAATASLFHWQLALWSVHGLAWVHVCVLGAVLVACVAHGGWFLGSVRWHAAAAVLLAVWTGLGEGSDKLVLVGAVIPCAVTGLLLLRLAPAPVRWRAGATALGIAASAVAVGAVSSALAKSAGITQTPFAVTGADAARRAANLKLLWKAGAALLGGDWTGHPVGSRHTLAVACAAVAAVGLVVGLAYALVALARAVARPAAANPVVATFVAFWASSLVILAAAFVWSTAPADVTSQRYIVSAAYALVALFLVAASGRQWTRAAAGAALTLVAFAGLVSLVNRDAQNAAAGHPDRDLANAVTRIGRQFGVTKGYASYFDAAPLTWLTRNEFHLYPTENCQPDSVCPYYGHMAMDWYKPEPGMKTMVIFDVVTPPGWPLMSGVSSKFGPAIYQETVLGRTILVYPFDVAAKFVRR